MGRGAEQGAADEARGGLPVLLWVLAVLGMLWAEVLWGERMQALNAFNLTNFLLFTPGNGITTTLGANATGFGQTSGAYRDLSNTNDPGGRIVEFSLRLNF